MIAVTNGGCLSNDTTLWVPQLITYMQKLRYTSSFEAQIRSTQHNALKVAEYLNTRKDTKLLQSDKIFGPRYQVGHARLDVITTKSSNWFSRDVVYVIASSARRAGKQEEHSVYYFLAGDEIKDKNLYAQLRFEGATQEDALNIANSI